VDLTGASGFVISPAALPPLVFFEASFTTTAQQTISLANAPPSNAIVNYTVRPAAARLLHRMLHVACTNRGLPATPHCTAVLPASPYTARALVASS
jgi:hypothetical protein